MPTFLGKTRQKIYGFLQRADRASKGDPDEFLKHCKAILHVGANDGVERELYARHSLDVVWVEALPEMFKVLENNLREFPKQKALNALVTDKENETYDFHVSNNQGASSSIYEFQDHDKIWPDVSVTKTIQLRSTTLSRLLRENGYSASQFDALVLDVQGAELLVLQGADELLKSLRFIKAEASDFAAYKNACTVETLPEFLKTRGFVVDRKTCFGRKRGVGGYYDILFKRQM
jgi:FkbM family methyltransferase